MLGGTMSMIDGPDARHLEVHICQRASGEVVPSANPTILFTDTTTGMTTPIVVATMEGVGQGQSDLHYGNNVSAPIGHLFAVTVTVHGEQVVLRFTRSS
jgi:hypothetical protein